MIEVDGRQDATGDVTAGRLRPLCVVFMTHDDTGLLLFSDDLSYVHDKRNRDSPSCPVTMFMTGAGTEHDELSEATGPISLVWIEGPLFIG